LIRLESDARQEDMMRQVLVMIVMAAVLVLAGCQRVVPVHNVPETQVYIPAEGDAGAVREAIVAGARAKGWRVSEEGPGHIVASIAVRSHTAVADIFYDATSYSIQYKDSSNLKYDGERIHRNYNKWVILLDQQIQANLPVQ
jgi:hypothetical protein